MGSIPEHRQCTGGMAPVGKYAAGVGGIKPVVILVLPGDGICSPAVWSIVMGAVIRDGEYGG